MNTKVFSPVNKLALFIFSLANVFLGVFYGLSDGPYVDIGNGRVISASELMSSGSEDGLAITIALLTFSVTAVVSRLKSTSVWVAAITYAANYFVYGFFIFLAQLDTSLGDSIRLGDWLLLVGLVAPVIPFFLMLMLGLKPQAEVKQPS